MVCYIIPLAAVIISAARRQMLRRKDKEGFWLNLMLLGGSVFGVVDHFWNGELFLTGPNLLADLSLGAVITASLFAGWGIIAYREKIAETLKFMNRKTGIYK